MDKFSRLQEINKTKKAPIITLILFFLVDKKLIILN